MLTFSNETRTVCFRPLTLIRTLLGSWGFRLWYIHMVSHRQAGRQAETSDKCRPNKALPNHISS